MTDKQFDDYKVQVLRRLEAADEEIKGESKILKQVIEDLIASLNKA